MLKIYIGNSLEELAERMSRNIGHDAHPLRKTALCIQTAGMQRWVSLELAKISGISANLDFLFPAALIKRFVEQNTGQKNLWTEKSELVWLVFRELIHTAPRPAFSIIREYLSDDTDQIKTFRLALRIADVFDQYQLYRPEMVMGWLDGQKELKGDELWQAELFRSVFRDRNRCKTVVLDSLIKQLESGGGRNMPRSAHLFGLSVIPPFFVDILNAASKYTDIYMYLLSPTRHYFGDSRSDREISRIEKRTGKSAEELGIWQNHPLLDNLGAIGRDFLENLLQKTDFNDEGFFTDRQPDTLLRAVQYEILNLEELNNFVPAPDDRSITVAGCHNPLREAEALYDYLLSLFDNDPTLNPADILVMTPDIRSMAPYIRSVFDNPYSPETAIPYAIADIPQKTDNAPAGVFMDIIDTITGDVSLSSLIRILDNDLVASVFGIKDSGFLAGLLDRNGGFFGLSTEELAQDGVTSDIRFTFDRAMRRLALGLAEGDSGRIYAEATGRDVPFSRAEEIGGLMRFVDLCGEYRQKLAGRMPPADWCALMMEMTEKFLSDSREYADDMLYLVKKISETGAAAEAIAEDIAFRPVYETLQAALDEAKGAKGFMSGRVTFCAMLPMRSIPFRVICMLGMDDSTFPRIKTSLEFDLMAKHPRKGDRTQRDSDKYLFLETLISARDRLYLSYRYKSESDNRPLVPSILITELTRHLQNRFHAENLMTPHRLHSFSRHYFDDERNMFTYSQERFRAAEAMLKRHAGEPFCKTEINAEIPADITLDEFERFFIDPPAFFLRHTLGIEPDKNGNLLPDTEKMTVSYLDRYTLRNMSLETALRGGVPEQALRYARMTAQIPSGGVGDACEANVLDYTRQAMDMLDSEQTQTETKDISVSVGGLRITGRIYNWADDGWMYVKAGSLKPKDFVRVWIRHAVVNAQTRAQSRILTQDGIKTVEPFDTGGLLAGLAKMFAAGLKKPLCFHPADGIKALDKLKFIADDNYSSAETDPAFTLCFNTGIDKEEMRRSAEAVLGGAEEHVGGGKDE